MTLLRNGLPGIRALFVAILLLAMGTLGGAAIAQTSGWQQPGDEVNNLQDAQAAINYWQLLPVSDDPSQARMWVAFGQMVDNMMEMDIRVGRGTMASRFAPIGSGATSGCSTDQIMEWNGTRWVCSTALADLQARVTEIEGLLSGISRADDSNGYDTLTFDGMNLRVTNGTGTTDGAPNGEGNVIIGYNLDEPTTGDENQSGSHNLVVGDDHTYTTHSGVITGLHNTLTGDLASVIGGEFNTASGERSFNAGGAAKIASGKDSFMGGGLSSEARGEFSFVGGGSFDVAGPGTCGFIADVVIGTC